MRRASSLEKVTGSETLTNVKNSTFISEAPEISSKPRFRSTYTNKRDNFNIIIKPKLFRSNSCSELTANSELNLDFINSTSQFISEEHHRNIYGSTGDSVLVSHTQEQYSANYPFMSWSFKGKKTKKKRVPPENMASKFASEYVPNFANEPHTIADTSLSTENSSSCSIDPNNKEASFPFKHTPSGNFKVQSNQVVFQSSTVGVLLADPTQAKVKVKFEGKTTTTGGDMETGFHEIELSSDMEAQTQYTQKEVTAMHAKTIDNRMKTKVKEEEGKDLESLGYALAEPIDWLRIQLPKKQDLFQEFYRRIHNYVNTDTVVHIGDDTFHCHHIVLQVYSEFFDQNRRNEMELPVSNVTPEAFQTVYEWMIFNGADSNKLLKRENVLEVFCAAQYLSIKDLEDQCWSFIVNENLFTEDTAFILFRQAREKGMTPVMDLMTPRIMRFFLPLVASKDFLDLEPEEVMTFLKSNYICVTSEIEVLMAGVRWLYGDWTNRRRLAVDVMRCVRFGLISPWQLVDIKRNPDNAEILEIVNEPEVQQMVDDGLAYVIIKYWYGNNSKNYYHWIDVLGLVEPAERNWIGEEKNHVTYKDFLKYLQQFMVPKEQFQQMAVMQPPRRSDEMPGTMRGMEDKMHLGRPKFDFPLPATLKNLTVPGDKDKSFPTMSEFFENRRKAGAGEQGPGVSPGGRQDIDMTGQMHQVLHDRRRSPDNDKHEEQRLQEQRNAQLMQAKQQLQMLQQQRRKQVQQVHMCTVTECKMEQQGHMFDPPERDSSEELPTTNSESSSDTAQCSNDRNREKRHSIAASYLASATAAMHGPGSPLQGSRKMSALPGSCLPARGSRSDPRAPNSSDGPITSPQISLFNQSKESLAKINMNKLSNSILGPSNKNYIAEGSLFNWDRETVLVFGGIDPHTSYGTGRNNGKDMFRFDPVTNVWDYVGDLPEPRHHHSVAFLRGRVYLVGGADPRDDDIRGKSVVVSTVWSYEPVSRSWYSENGLAVPRKNFGLVVHRMALYAIGGQDKRGRVLSSVERFDPKTGSWAEVRPMGVARMAVATVKYRDYIWVAGGMTGEKKKPVCKIVECYNSRTNEWTEIHSLRFPRCFATLFSMNDKLYIVGGAGKVSGKDKTASSVGAIDVWDWKDREWKLETEMSIPRHGHALAYLGTQLIIIGGVTTIYMRALSNVESFCCERGAWIRGVTPLPSPLSGHGAVTLPPASLM